MPPGFQHLTGFFYIALGVAACQRPCNLDRLRQAAAEQFGQRNTQTLRLRVEQCGFNGTFREPVALIVRTQLPHCSAGPRRWLAFEQRREVGVDIDLDTFRALLAISEAADGRAFAQPDYAVRATDTHQDEGLAIHRCHGQPVGPNGGDIDQNRLDVLDLHVLCSHSLISLEQCYELRVALSKTDYNYFHTPGVWRKLREFLKRKRLAKGPILRLSDSQTLRQRIRQPRRSSCTSPQSFLFFRLFPSGPARYCHFVWCRA